MRHLFLPGLMLVALTACATAPELVGNDGGEDEEEVGATAGSGGALAGTGGSQATGTPGPPGCRDGLQNGDEEGVDCGGDCPPCCEPTTYEKTSGLASGSTTACCDAGDTLALVTDCGVGANHGAKAEGACGVGFEGEMNGGDACVTITCETGCGAGGSASSSGSSSSSSSAASSSSSGAGGSPGSCAHDECEEGAALDPSCSTCADVICSNIDAYCCDFEWDEFCVAAVAEACGKTC